MKWRIDDYWKPQLRVFFFFFLYLIKPRFYYVSADLMRSASHGDVSMMVYRVWSSRTYSVQALHKGIAVFNGL